MARKRCIAIFLGSLVALTIGHNVVPHHHHLGDVYSHEGCHPQDGFGLPGITDDPAWHCHAFNGLEYIPGQEELSPCDPWETNAKDLAPISLKDPVMFSWRVWRSGEGGIPYLFSGHPGISPGLRAPPLA